METTYDDLWEMLTVEQQQAVARGDVSLEELLELATTAAGAEVCPICCTRPVRVKSSGWCRPCTTRALNDAFHERIAMVEAYRERTLLKKNLQRAREVAGIPTPRSHAYKLPDDRAELMEIAQAEGVDVSHCRHTREMRAAIRRARGVPDFDLVRVRVTARDNEDKAPARHVE